ncbi:ETC complex I subunit conserved region-domain-containing protein [Chytriomyces sp. MP71]|nr:ETC complex I subunit conserved region-domain-containing protein [Chytriomyces sp. MP71]
MLRVSRLLRQAAHIKETTGLTGVAVHPNPRPELLSLYQRIQHTAQRLPADSVYRRSVDSTTAFRLAVVEKEADVEAIEKQIDAGQIEELMKQAEDEIALIAQMAEWEAWKPLDTKIPEGQWTSATV